MVLVLLAVCGGGGALLDGRCGTGDDARRGCGCGAAGSDYE